MMKLDSLKRLYNKGKVQFVSPSTPLEQAYLKKSEQGLLSAKVLYREQLYEYTIITAYFGMYNAALALLFKIGIMSQTHTSTIMLLGICFPGKDTDLHRAKQQRLANQYFVTDQKIMLEPQAKQMIDTAELFCLELRSLSLKITGVQMQALQEQIARAVDLQTP